MKNNGMRAREREKTKWKEEIATVTIYTDRYSVSTRFAAAAAAAVVDNNQIVIIYIHTFVRIVVIGEIYSR